MGAGLEEMAMKTFKIPDGVTEQTADCLLRPRRVKRVQQHCLRFICIVFLTMELMCLGRGCLRVSVVPREVRSVRSPGVTGRCEPPDVVPANQTQVLCRTYPQY